MKEIIDFSQINAIDSKEIQIVESIHTVVNQQTGQPAKIQLKLATDRHKHPHEALTIPVYIPVSFHHSPEHFKLMEQFKSGELFVAIRCHNLTIYRKSINSIWQYYGFADSFTVVDYQGGNTL